MRMILVLLAALAAACGASPAFAQATPWDQYSRVYDVQSGPYLGVVAMSVDTTYPAGRALRLNCSASGNVSLALLDGSSETYVAAAGYQVIPLAVTKVNSAGTTATCTYGSLK